MPLYEGDQLKQVVYGSQLDITPTMISKQILKILEAVVQFDLEFKVLLQLLHY